MGKRILQFINILNDNEIKKININPKPFEKKKRSISGLDEIMELQQTVGNQAVAQMIESGEISIEVNRSTPV